MLLEIVDNFCCLLLVFEAISPPLLLEVSSASIAVTFSLMLTWRKLCGRPPPSVVTVVEIGRLSDEIQ